MSVRLFTTENEDPHYDLEAADDDLKNHIGENFVRARVTSGTWIFYTHSKYNDKQFGGGAQSYLMLTAQDGAKNIKSVNGSARLVPNQTEGVVLYEHYYYGGTELWVEDHCDDLISIFPAGSSGVSSAIVLSESKTFHAFKMPNYEGIEAKLEPGKKYPAPGDLVIGNDKIRSIR